MAVSDYPLTEVSAGIECRCPDEQAHEVAALVATGMGQWQASQQVYGERGRLSASIRTAFLLRFPDLRLPPVGGAV